MKIMWLLDNDRPLEYWAPKWHVPCYLVLPRLEELENKQLAAEATGEQLQDERAQFEHYQKMKQGVYSYTPSPSLSYSVIRNWRPNLLSWCYLKMKYLWGKKTKILVSVSVFCVVQVPCWYRSATWRRPGTKTQPSAHTNIAPRCCTRWR